MTYHHAVQIYLDHIRYQIWQNLYVTTNKICMDIEILIRIEHSSQNDSYTGLP